MRGRLPNGFGATDVARWNFGSETPHKTHKEKPVTNRNYEENLEDWSNGYGDIDTYDEDVARHVKTCTKAERDEYCKICLEY